MKFGAAFAVIAAVRGAGPTALFDATPGGLAGAEQTDGGISACDAHGRRESLERLTSQFHTLDGDGIVRSLGYPPSSSRSRRWCQ